MYRFSFSLGLFLASFILSHARGTVFISKNGEKTFSPISSESNVCTTPTCVTAAADVLDSLDESVDPCDDFYSFACGGWLKRHQWSTNILAQTQNDLTRRLRDLLESEYKISDPPFVKKLKDFYNTCVNLDVLEKEGSKPLKKMLTRLGGWPVVEGSQWDENAFDWIETLISFRKLGYNFNILISLNVYFEHKRRKVFKLYFQAPDTQYIAGENENISLGLDDPEIAAYYRMMVKAAKLLGADESTAEKELLDVLHFEMALLNITVREKKKFPFIINYFIEIITRRNIPKTFAELQKEVPKVPWLKIVNGLLLTNQAYENETFLTFTPDYLVKFADLITSTDKRVIANFLLWTVVVQSKTYLSGEWGHIKREEKSRWKECLNQVKKNMKIGLSSYYVRNYFSVESKDEAIVLMKYIQKELVKMMENNDWMDEKTKEIAEEKARAIKAYIGFPNELLNDTFMMEKYENLLISNYSYLENILAIKKWRTDDELSTPRNKFVSKMKLFYMFPNILEVNGYYNWYNNRIEIPAGILHGALYDKNRPKYMNFAAIGSIIGHEITHGYDNFGRQLDKHGKPLLWWDKESDEQFTKKVKCIIDQYDNYTTEIGLKINGRRTQNENIADNGGLKEAYLAYQSWTKDHGTELLLPGVNYTQNQMFWISAAHITCSKYEPEQLKQIVLYRSHSPFKFRIIGPISNLAAFSNDFKCSPDAPMNPKYKCEVW